MHFAIILIEIFLIAELRKRIKIVNASELTCLFVLGSHITYAFYMGSPSPAWMRFNLNYESMVGFYIYFMIFCISYASTINIRITAENKIGIKYGSLLNYSEKFNSLFILIAYLIIALFLLSIKTQSLLYSFDREFLNDDKSYYLAIGPFIRIVLVLMSLAAAYFFAISISLVSIGTAKIQNLLACLLWLPALAFLLALPIAEASRYSVVIIGIVGATIFVFSNIPRAYTIGITAATGYLLWISALVSRSSISYGLSMVPDFLLTPFRTSLERDAVLINVFEGIFATSEGLLGTADFPLSYMILSFSPLPGALDGFAALRDIYQVRITWWIPMSAVAETYHFGPIFMVLFYTPYFFAFRMTLIKREQLGNSFFICSLMNFLSISLACAYPVRNGFRFVLISLALVFFFSRFRRINNNTKT